MNIKQLTVELLGCHPFCVEVVGADHRSEINPVGFSTDWRLECPGCTTVLKIFPTYEEAIRGGILHAINPNKFYPPHWFDTEGCDPERPCTVDVDCSKHEEEILNQ